jgi:hypothetical protein
VYANRTLYADVPFALRIRELMTHELAGNRSLIRAQIRDVIDYSAKLGRRGNADDIDLFTVLPGNSTTLTQVGVQIEPASGIGHQ